MKVYYRFFCYTILNEKHYIQNTLHDTLSLRLKAVDYAARRSDWIIQLFNKIRALSYNVQT